MRKQAPHIEWQIVENDADWERLCAPPTPEPMLAASPHFPAQRLLGYTVILLLLASASAWWWRTRPSRVLQDEGTAAPVVAHQPDHFVASATDHQSDPGWWLRQRQEVQELRTAVQTAEPDTQMDIALDTVEVHGDLALASVVLYARNSRSAYRQTRFYRRTSNTWVPTAPDVTLWGPKRSLATPYFIFLFRQYDAQAVIAVAPQIDALYTTLWHNFGLPIMPTPEKLVIEVSVTQQPGLALDQPFREHRLVVPSPAIYRAPVESTDADLLVQSLALPLLAHVLAQASERYQIGATWQPMMDGLRLWQMWDMDLPLALWREEIVRWLYLDQPTTDSAQTVVLPKQYEKLCTAHALWMAAPTMIGIPLLCNGLDWQAWHTGTGGLRHPPARLDQLTVPVPDGYAQEEAAVWSQTVALATLIEYAEATYGRERLPLLLGNLGQFDTWETLIPAVYGVSAAEFEVGWQEYLSAYDDALANRVTPSEVPLRSPSSVRQSVHALDRKEP